jgi:putative DNA primase/helicase
MITSCSPNSNASASSVARALADRAEQVAIVLLGKPSSTNLHECRWGRHGSMCLRRSGARRGRWHDFERGEGGDLLDLIARQYKVPLAKAIELSKREFLGEAVQTRAKEPPHAAVSEGGARSAAAQRLWREAKPIVDTMAERYFLEQRRLDIGRLELGHALRWHARTSSIIALMSDATSGEPLGVHRTFIDKQGAKIERKMLGHQGVVRLSPDKSVTIGLGITEGIEDGIAILLSGWAPVWAATSAGALAKHPVLGGVECLTLFADADAPGMKAAITCRDRWLASGREAVIAAPRRLP